MSRKVFILLPALVPTGPVKGAFALANGLSATHSVTIVTLRSGPGANARLSEKVAVRTLGASKERLGHLVRCYRELLSEAGGRSGVASISMCYSADSVNRYLRDHAVLISSVRGNLLRNYRADYGVLGLGLAVTHLLKLRAYDHVVAMTQAMGRQIRVYSGKQPRVIGNFVDEEALEEPRRLRALRGPYARNPRRFAFIGSLTERKQPLRVIEALHTLLAGGLAATLDIVGDGPLRTAVEARVTERRLQDKVTVHGFVADPYRILLEADVLVLPSYSEGVPRAALEALYLGIPCVMRAVDGNSELICEGRNGVIFSRDDRLADAMAAAMELALLQSSSTSLLPSNFQQDLAVRKYAELVDGDAGQP